MGDWFCRGLEYPHQPEGYDAGRVPCHRKPVVDVRNDSQINVKQAALLTPFSGLGASLLVAAVPLQDPSLGALANPGVWIQGAVLTWLALFSAMVGFRASISIAHRVYPTVALAAIATLATAQHIAVVVLLGVYWRFPVPFSFVLGLVPYSASILLAHCIVLRDRFLENHDLRRKLLTWLPSFGVQISQVTLYAFYSTVFARANDWQRLVLVVFFPLLKYVLKRAVFALSHDFGDYACESAVSGIEICAATYQTMVVQSAPSPVVAASIIALDVLLCVVEIHRMLHRETVVPCRQLLPRALELLGDATRLIQDAALPPPTATRVKTQRLRLTMPSASAILPAKPRVPGTSRDNATDKLVVAQALSILQAAEVVVLVEYYEVVVPLLNAVYVAIASQQQSAIYNPKLRAFYHDAPALQAAVGHILIYTSLQAATLVGMGVAMRVRYGVSGLVLLAFVLEHHGWAIQAKFVCWIPLMLSFSVLHYGVDFTFQFDWTEPPAK